MAPGFPSLPLQAHVCVGVCTRVRAHTLPHTQAYPRGLCDMLYLIFIPSLQSPGLKVPLCLSALLPVSSWSSTFLKMNNCQGPGLLLGRVWKDVAT